MKTITLIGSTGSIGTQTLDVCRKNNISVKALSAGTNYKLLASQALEFSVEKVCIFDESYAENLRELLDGSNIKILTGLEGLCEIAQEDEVDLFVNSVVGMVGLLPTLKAIEKGTDVALANKETLVAGGEIVMNLAREKGVSIIPIDSEHSAIFQCLQGEKSSQLKGIILTASGGAFFGKTKAELEKITVNEALKHPNWSMGRKITVDSSTLMNKGLEFIEACRLFDVSAEQIEVVVNRESVIHSAVEFMDNSVIAQLGVPDMKIPIQYALMYPNRVSCDVKRLKLTEYGKLTFFEPDFETFVCLKSCIEAVRRGGNFPCIVNSVNEEAVALFLAGEISFLKIGELVEKSLEYFSFREVLSYEDVMAEDALAREFVQKFKTGRI